MIRGAATVSDVAIEADAFGATLSNMLERLGTNVMAVTPDAVEEALDVGEQAWKRNAKAVLSGSYSRGGWGKVRGYEMYSPRGKKRGQIKSIKWYGKTFKTGKYARSIRHRMLRSDGYAPEGEIGSASMPGLAHLLEKGHEGPAPAGAHQHIADAADESFRALEDKLSDSIEKAINDI